MKKSSGASADSSITMKLELTMGQLAAVVPARRMHTVILGVKDPRGLTLSCALRDSMRA
jgi:hypothetical protein